MFRIILIILVIITFPVWSPIATKIWSLICDNFTLSDLFKFISDCFNQIFIFSKKIISLFN